MSRRHLWRVTRGRWGSWIVHRGIDAKCAFTSWREAYDYAHEQAVMDGLNIIGVEVAS